MTEREAAFHNKFEKYTKVKSKQRLDSKHRESIDLLQKFDITTKSQFSPSKRTLNYTQKTPQTAQSLDLIPAGYEEHIVRQDLLNAVQEIDPFVKHGITSEEKMSFFLLKWVFNACQVDDTVHKEDLVMTLEENPDILQALNKGSIESIAQRLEDY